MLLLGATLVVSSCAWSDSSAELHALLEEAWSFELQEDPLFATFSGQHEFNDQLPSVTARDEERRTRFRRGLLKRLGRIDREKLSEADKINYDLFEYQVGDRVEAFSYRPFEIPINADSGFHISFARLPNRLPLETSRDYENYIARLRAFPHYVEQHIELMRSGLSRGFTLPRVVMNGYEVTIASHIVEDAAQSVFYIPLDEFSQTVPPAEQPRLREMGKKAILGSVVPGYQSFLDFMKQEYIPGARTLVGASELPNGRDFYAYLMRHFTTLDVGAQEVHQLGIEEVRRIREEMLRTIREIDFAGSFPEFLEFLRTDSRFYANTPSGLLREAAYIAKRMEAKLPSLFKTLPRLPYGIQPVPDHLAPKYTGGRYVPAAIGGTAPGYYWVNTYDLASRPLYVLEALTFHEAVPGHHLQIALQQELEDLPNFRRFARFTAFGEGWGLYSERLGLEAGFYKDPYSNFGRLTYEMWRACRLVVDTGIHAMGWSRQKAMDFLAANTALSLHEIATETDRYIAWPGQALAYKMGELKIRELRLRAERVLGDRFDVRKFHDAVLENGALPLPVLEKQIERFIATGGE